MLPVMALGIQPGHRVLELCAAPGSKTMQILDLLQHDGATTARGLLVANDFKQQRLQMLLGRARRVPSSTLLVTCADAQQFPDLKTQKGHRLRFDRVLCDVPCSGDGTVRKALGLLSQWSAQGGLAQHAGQLAILQRGLELLAPGGLLAYTTCALNPAECEAVVASALWEARGAVETCSIEVPGLRLAEGLTSWKVPVGGELYSSWQEVPNDLKTTRVQRSMFPPGAYTSSEAAAEAIGAQLRKCGRLLPSHDDGGCFFLALFRRSGDGVRRFRRGDKVLVQSTGRVAVVREPSARGQFSGLVRVAYGDGSTYHVAAEGLRAQCGDEDVAFGGTRGQDGQDSEALEGSIHGSPLLPSIADGDWRLIADFFGFEFDVDAAAESDQVTLLKGALCLSPEFPLNGVGAHAEVLCLASSDLASLASAASVQAAGRPAFVRTVAKMEGKGDGIDDWPSGVFPWRPTLEAAHDLSRCCRRRVARPTSAAAVQQLLTVGRLPAADIGANASWSPGAIFIVPPAAGEDVGAYVGLLQDEVVRLVVQKGFGLNYGSFAEPCRFVPGTIFRCGEDTRSRWVPSSRRCAR